jgi:hypothetical protein
MTCCGLLLAIAAASPNCRAGDFKFDGGGGADTDFLTAANWDDNNVPVADSRYSINDNFVATYATNVATSVTSLIVGGDAPQTPGPFGTPGTLNMSAGSLTVTGGGDSFNIARACCSGTGIMNMTGNAALNISGTDPQIGQRDHGELNIHDTASVTSPNGYWRLGNYGPAIDAGLEGDGLLNVTDNGTFSAMVIFLGDGDSDGELRVSGNGSVVLSDNLVPNIATDRPNRSSLVHMIGSTATLSAKNLESFNGAAQVHNQYRFTADAGGVSPVTLSNAINIGNNDLTVDLTSFDLAPLSSLLLFDAAPGQIYGDGPTFFSNVSVLGGQSASNYFVFYNQTNGDISLVRTVPEPSTMLLLGLSLGVCICVKRRVSR